MFCPMSRVPRFGSWLKLQVSAQFWAAMATVFAQQSGSSGGLGVGLAFARVLLCCAVMPVNAAGSVSQLGGLVVVVVVLVVVVVVVVDVVPAASTARVSTQLASIVVSVDVVSL